MVSRGHRLRSRAPGNRGKGDAGPHADEHDDSFPFNSGNTHLISSRTPERRKTGGAAPVLIAALLAFLSSCHEIKRMCYSPDELACDDYHEAMKTHHFFCCCYLDDGSLRMEPGTECMNAICRWDDFVCPSFFYEENDHPKHDGSGVPQPGMATQTPTPNPCFYEPDVGCLPIPTPVPDQ